MTLPADARSGVAALAAELAEAGDLPRDWRDACLSVPRHLFIPEQVWREQDAGFVPISRGDDPEAWWDEVYANRAIVTQVDDGREPTPGAAGDHATSSASMPSLVFWMLDELGVRERQRVLEIGTGTGYNAALLAACLGDVHVTTIEVDADVAEHAAKALGAAGWHPTVVTGDGAGGYAPNAPYDRVIATCAVRRVPYAWVAQTRPGGRILTPWGTGYSNKGLARLTVGDHGTATGPFVGGTAFMRLRSQRQLHGHVDDYVHDEARADRTTATLDPREVFGDEHAEFAIGVQVAGCQQAAFYADDGSGAFTLWLLDGLSWASVDYEPDIPACPVDQYGPRRLWDEVAGAYRRWVGWGRPERERFGLTVTPQGQYVWLDEPARTVTHPDDAGSLLA